MRKDLVKQGLLDKDGKLTQKGHEYVETTKRDLKTKATKAGEQIERTIREAESILDRNDGSDGGPVRGAAVRSADVDSRGRRRSNHYFRYPLGRRPREKGRRDLHEGQNEGA